VLDAAVRRYRGEFMAGFSLRDSPPFDEWQYLQADAARRDLAWALEQVATHFADRGDWSAATAHAKHWLSLDELQEPAHRLLMRLYAAAGDRASAIRQYRECVQILDRELDVAPLEETVALYEAIMERRLPEPQPSSQAPSDGALGQTAPPEFPLVGRAAERDAIIEAYELIGRSGA
jgi:DNA-binding SARP family transcriptional activator